MNRVGILQVLFLLIGNFGICQSNDSLFERLQAVSNRGATFYNVDGIEISCQLFQDRFSQKGILKNFRRYSIKSEDLITSDSLLHSQNYYVIRKEDISPRTTRYTSYHFIENSSKVISAIIFTTFNDIQENFKREFINLIYQNQIPASVFTSFQVDSINFAGRKIAFGESCRWMGINNLQCPYYGQMNWSLHKNLEGAIESANSQYDIINLKKQGKIISEEFVDVIFEGTETKAKRIIYDIKGITSILIGISGAKTLTIYFIASPVRNTFVSCVLSHWDNDSINPGSLSPLLEKVMKLKKN